MKHTSSDSPSARPPAWRLVWRLGLLPLFMVLALAACGPGGKRAAEVSPVGDYTLTSVDGKAVPCAVQHGATALTVKSGAFSIRADGTCGSTVVFSTPSGRDSTREVKATYRRQGSVLTMTWEGAGTTTGRVEGDTFTMNNEGMIFAYRK